MSDGKSCFKDCKLLSEKSTGNTSTGTFYKIFLSPKTSKFILGTFIGLGASVVIVLIALMVVWIYLKKPNMMDSIMKTKKPNILLPVERDSNLRESIIFKKGDDLKNNVVYSTEDERKRFEEFTQLETKVATSITLVKTTEVSREEDNAKHNRYRDIGKATIINCETYYTYTTGDF